MHNFDLILNYFCENTEKMSKSGGTLYIGVPPLQILGERAPPLSPKVYSSGVLQDRYDDDRYKTVFHDTKTKTECFGLRPVLSQTTSVR